MSFMEWATAYVSGAVSGVSLLVIAESVMERRGKRR